MRRLVIGFSLWIVFLAPMVIAAVEPTPEARECYRWLASLGFPEIKDAAWAKVLTARTLDDRDLTRDGFIVRSSPTDFDVLWDDLSVGTFKRVDRDELPRYWQSFKPASLTSDARDLLAVLRSDQRPEYRSALPFKGRAFFFSYACWRKGESELAQELFDEAKKLPVIYEPGKPDRHLSFRKELEAEIGTMEMWDAILRAGGATLGGDRWGGTPPDSRPTSLARFRRVAEVYPASEYHDEAIKTAATLEKMIAEDAVHPKQPPEAIEKLSRQEQAAEWVFQLRDLNAHQYSQPGSVELFGNYVPVKNPIAEHLLALGDAAAPLLIAANDDPRITHTVVFWRDFHFSHRIYTIGDSAIKILDQIFGQAFAQDIESAAVDYQRSAALNMVMKEWWAETRNTREGQALLESISPQEKEQFTRILKERYPTRAGEAPQIQAFARLLDAVYAHDLDRDKRLSNITLLINRQDPAALPLLTKEWARFSPAQKAMALPLQDLITLLIASGEEEAIQLLSGEWDRLPPWSRFFIVERLGTPLSTNRWGPSIIFQPLSPKAKETALALLVHATGDLTRYGGNRVSRGLVNFPDDPRIGDCATWSLHQLAPETYPFTEDAPEKQRDAERVAAGEIWRRIHSIESPK